VFAATTVPCWPQVPVQTQKAELAIPFGVVMGRVVTVEITWFLSMRRKPESSFAITRSGMRNLSTAAEVLTVETVKTIRCRGGEMTVFSFRLATPQETPPFAEWFKATAEPPMFPFRPGRKPKKRMLPKVEAAASAKTYQARHDHFRAEAATAGSSFEPDRVVFESVGEIDHSRQWTSGHQRAQTGQPLQH